MRLLSSLIIVLVLFSCSNSKKKKREKELTVFAAASLADVIIEISDSFRLEHEIKVQLNIAGSGTLARQIEQGAQADIYLSANKGWTEYLVEKEKSYSTSVFALNDLVLISSAKRTDEVSDISDFLSNINGKIAIGDPGYVPAGKYATQVLEYYELDLSPKLFQTVDVRSALMMVEMGEIPFGIVYRTDALQSKKVKLIYTFSEESHEAVEYYRVLTSQKDLANEFYDYLYSAKAKEILQKYSFIVN